MSDAEYPTPHTNPTLAPARHRLSMPLRASRIFFSRQFVTICRETRHGRLQTVHTHTQIAIRTEQQRLQTLLRVLHLLRLADEQQSLQNLAVLQTAVSQDGAATLQFTLQAEEDTWMGSMIFEEMLQARAKRVVGE